MEMVFETNLKSWPAEDFVNHKIFTKVEIILKALRSTTELSDRLNALCVLTRKMIFLFKTIILDFQTIQIQYFEVCD